MKIYLATKYAEMIEMRGVRDRIVAEGHEVTAQWIDGKEDNDTQETAAVMDYNDVARADLLISFSKERGTLHTGGGRHVEYGIAMALKKTIWVVGPRGEHVFHAWPDVRFFESVDDMLESLR